MRWARANERWHARIALFTLVAGCRSVDRTAPADSTRTDDLARQRTAAAIPAAPPIPPPPDVSAAPAVDLELVELGRAPPTPTDLLAPPKKALRLPSGLALLVLKKGQGIEHPSMQGRVTMHFSGWKTDGTLVESTTMGGRPALFEVRELIPGWREGLLRMVVGEKTRLWIPAMLAYGNEPTRRGVPAGPLVYDIELLSLETER